MAHNGTLTNFLPLRRHYEGGLGARFRHSVDSELLGGISFLRHFRETGGDEFEAMGGAVFEEVRGGPTPWPFSSMERYSSRGTPPSLQAAELRPGGDGHYFASEDSALRLFVDETRDVRPGEVFLLSEGGEVENRVIARERHHHCVFEYIYFARPDSTIDGVNVYLARVRMGGQELAKESPADGGDVVVAVPDSGRAAALGFSQVSGIPLLGGTDKEPLHREDFHNPGGAVLPRAEGPAEAFAGERGGRREERRPRR